MKITKAAPERRTQSETRGLLWTWLLWPSPARARARVRRIHAATSFNAPAATAMPPRRVVRSLNSAKMRASTPKAVTERATPMKTRNGAKATWSAPARVLRRIRARAMPEAKGRDIPATAMANAFLPLRRIETKSSSSPMRKRKKRSPMLATVSSSGVLHDGNTRCLNVLFLPSTDGPNTIPPRISAMTLGWRRGLMRKARVRVRRMIKVIWTIRRGKAKSKGLSPCHSPLEDVLMEVMLNRIFAV